jgi:hypothetical protein
VGIVKKGQTRPNTEGKAMSTAVPKHFDTDVVNRLAQTREIKIETRRPGAGAAAHRATIWVVVVGDDAYIRSFHGNGGRWYQEIKANPGAAVHVEGQRVPVRAVPVTDDATVARVSDEYRRKYGSDLYVSAMVRDEVLPTTLRLEPQ